MGNSQAESAALANLAKGRGIFPANLSGNVDKQFAALKLTSAGYAQCGTTDTDITFAAIALQSRGVGDPANVDATRDDTFGYPALWDGSSTGAIGDRVSLSTTTGGRFMKSANGSFVLTSAVPAVADAIINIAPVGGGASGNQTLSGNLSLGDGNTITLLNTTVATTQAIAETLQNTTPSTNGNQQYSPALVLVGHGFDTGAGADRFNRIMLQQRSVQGNPVLDKLFLAQSIDTGTASWSDLLSIWASANSTVVQSPGIGNGTLIELKSGEVDFSPNGTAAVFVTSGEMGAFNDLSLALGDASRRFTSIFTRHLVGGQSAVPGTAAGPAAGSSPTISISAGSNDMSGTLNVTTGTSTTGANAILVTVTFNTAFGAAPRVVLTPANNNAAGLTSTTQVFVDDASITTAVWVVKVGSIALTASTAYKWFYHVIG